jgi:hypothetical protein
MSSVFNLICGPVILSTISGKDFIENITKALDQLPYQLNDEFLKNPDQSIVLGIDSLKIIMNAYSYLPVEIQDNIDFIDCSNFKSAYPYYPDSLIQMLAALKFCLDANTSMKISVVKS